METKHHELQVDNRPEAQLPEDSMGDHRQVPLTVRILPDGEPTRLRLPANAALHEVLADGANNLNVELLPPAPQQTLDRLHNIGHHNVVGQPIENLDQTLADFIGEKGATHDFGIELVLAFRVNTRWAVATAPQMTPKEILDLPAIDLDYTQYTLYLPESADPLPLDQPIEMTRGMALEAQRDGKYGGR